jgi:hypothetical protein
MRAHIGMLFILAFLFPLGASAETDPQVGTWKENAALSKYESGPPARSNTVTMTSVDGGIKLVSDSVNARGEAIHTEFTVKFDGKDYPFKQMIGGKPNTGIDTIVFTKADDYTTDNTTKLKGQVVGTAHIVYSRDGKTRTRTATGKNAQGNPVVDTLVYDRQ